MGGEAGAQRGEVLVGGLHHDAAPVEADDLGRPLDAENVRTMRPFSRRWAMVSTPLPVRSRYATVWGSSTANVSRPFGEQLR